MLTESKYVRHNQNPFGNENAGDCVVRSLSKALNISYEKICEMLGKGFQDKIGLRGNIMLNDLIEFSKKYSLIKAERFDNSFFDYVYREKPYVPRRKWPSLKEFVDKNSGKYIVLVRPEEFEDNINNPERDEAIRIVFRGAFHVVFADCDKKEYYDLMRNDPGTMKVYGYFRVL